MSREIRFRIYDKKCKSYIGDETGFTLQSLLLAPCDGAEDKISDYIFEQDTGLVDKNGTKIFEGDIVEGDMGVFKVKWYDLVARFMFTPNIDMKWHPPFVYDQVKEMEVIGNIHENKNL